MNLLSGLGREETHVLKAPVEIAVSVSPIVYLFIFEPVIKIEIETHPFILEILENGL